MVLFVCSFVIDNHNFDFPVIVHIGKRINLRNVASVTINFDLQMLAMRTSSMFNTLIPCFFFVWIRPAQRRPDISGVIICYFSFTCNKDLERRAKLKYSAFFSWHLDKKNRQIDVRKICVPGANQEIFCDTMGTDASASVYINYTWFSNFNVARGDW